MLSCSLDSVLVLYISLALNQHKLAITNTNARVSEINERDEKDEEEEAKETK